MPQDKPTPQRVSFADQVYAQLQRLIQRGEYPVNSRLPPEQELSQRFGVSRPIIRQALHRLSQEGVVESRKGSGTVVRIGQASLQAGFPPLNSVADVQQFYEFRIDIESRAAALASIRPLRHQSRPSGRAICAWQRTSTSRFTAPSRRHPVTASTRPRWNCSPTQSAMSAMSSVSVPLTKSTIGPVSFCTSTSRYLRPFAGATPKVRQR
jgi:DNA-binding transcriptional MocR family regulator